MGAVEIIGRLEREYPASRWVKPARSLRIEIAQRLQRNDVLWYTAAPPPPPAAPTPWSPATPVAAAGAAAPPAAPVPVPPLAAAARGRTTGASSASAGGSAAHVWVPEGFFPDMDLRIQALAQPDAHRCGER